jgi:peptidoglycan hydrolase-like protein with peptidoglycan-binding domain
MRPSLKKRGVRRVGAGVALLAVAAVVVVIVSRPGSSPAKRDTGAKLNASDTTTVKRRDLVATDTESGTLSYAGPATVYDRLSGTLTWLPRVGQAIKPGGTLFKVDGKPVILMNGTTPAYRNLTSSDSSGQDIEELNRNLVALGFNPDGIVIDDQWQAATTAGVEAFQASLREPETGSLSLGQVVFLSGDQLVSAVDATLGSTASQRTSGAKPEFVGLQKPAAAKHGSGHAPATGAATPKTNHKHAGKNRTKSLEALLALMQAEIGALKAAQKSPPTSPSNGGKPPSSNNGSLSSDSGGGSATPILRTTSTRQIVTVDLDPSKQSEARRGARVTVELPGGNTVEGRVSGVSPVAQSSGNSDNGNGSGNSGSGNNSGNSGSTIPVTISLSRRHAHAGLDQAAVSVYFEHAHANRVLSVPVTALLATAGGRYAVQAAAAPHRLIPVTTGLFAAGYVQISGREIHPGLQVTDSQG